MLLKIKLMDDELYVDQYAFINTSMISWIMDLNITMIDGEQFSVTYDTLNDIINAISSEMTVKEIPTKKE